MLPELEIGPLTLQTFGLMVGLGFIAAGLVLSRRLEELGKDPELAYEMVFAALVGGLLGAKLWFVVESGDFGELLSGTGLVWYGGALGGAAAVLLWSRWRGMFHVSLLDMCAPGLALGYAVGRLGCQLAGDGDYGVPSDLPWAMAYPNGTVPTTEEVHPTPIYEFLAMTAVAYVLWRLRDRMPVGGIFALYLVLAGTERFLIELIRRNEEVLLGLSTAQYVSAVMVVAGAALLWRLRTRTPAPPPRPAARARAA